METIKPDLMNAVLDGIKYTRDVWTSHPTLVKDPDDKDPKTNRPKGSVKQLVTVDYTGLTLGELVAKAANTDIIKYQNGYARKAEPSEYLLNEDGSERKTFVIKVKDFFKGRASADPIASTKRNVSKAKSLDDLKAMQQAVEEEIKARTKQSK